MVIGPRAVPADNGLMNNRTATAALKDSIIASAFKREAEARKVRRPIHIDLDGTAVCPTCNQTPADGVFVRSPAGVLVCRQCVAK